MSRAQALTWIRRCDRGRARFVRTYLHQDPSETLSYDLTVNTDRLEEEEVARLIGGVVLRRMGWGGAGPGVA